MWLAWILQYTRRTGVLHTMGESIYQSWLWHILNMLRASSPHHHHQASLQDWPHCKHQLSDGQEWGDDLSFPLSHKDQNGRTCKDEQVLLFELLILGSLWETCSPVRAVPTPAWQRKAREYVITLNDKTTKLQTENIQTANHKQKGDELLHYHPPLLQDWGPRGYHLSLLEVMYVMYFSFKIVGKHGGRILSMDTQNVDACLSWPLHHTSRWAEQNFLVNLHHCHLAIRCQLSLRRNGS